MTTGLPPRPVDATPTVTKAPRLRGVHPNTVRAWSDAGRLRYYRINPRGDRRYRLGDLQRFLSGLAGGDGERSDPTLDDRRSGGVAGGDGGRAAPPARCPAPRQWRRWSARPEPRASVRAARGALPTRFACL